MTRATRTAVGPARGVLRSGTGNFHHARYAPSPELAPFVAHYWTVRWDLRGQPPFLTETLPHPSVHIVFEPRRPEVGGIATGRFTRRLHGLGRVFAVKFRPAAFQPFFGASVGRLSNRTVSLRSIFGPEAVSLRRAILSSETDDVRIDLLESFLRAHLPAIDPEMVALRDLVERMAVDRTITRVDQLLPILETDARRLQRLLHRYVGATPKWVIQRYRLHEASEQLAADPTQDMAALAQSLGYFDQAHFIRDFKAMVGRSPGQYAKDRGKDVASRGRR